MERKGTQRQYQYDYLVAGSGLAGLQVALRAARYGRVAVVTKSWIRESNSYYAQGGIAAVTDAEDSPHSHLSDTLAAGRGLCDWPAVEILVNDAPLRIRELIDAGMEFDRTDGVLALGLEGGHHHRRILHAGGDATGAMITSFLAGKVASHPQIDIYENHTVLEALLNGGACWGLRAWNVTQGCEVLFVARHTLLTLGGTSAIFQRSTNPSITIGDGISIAWNAGCEIVDFEFIQFHPTALYAGDGGAYLVSEAVRGEGAYLRNAKGERFMAERYPLAELEPRDVVAQAIFREIHQQEEPYVWLDLRHLDGEKIRHRFPNIYRHCEELGLDMRQQIPVAPAAHYTVGGVRTNLYGQTRIPNLYACGELAFTGIMGANRLASNSLIECLVFGYRAVEQTLLTPRVDLPEEFAPLYHMDPSREELAVAYRKQISGLLNDYVGIVRSGNSLRTAQGRLKELRLALPPDAYEYYTHACQSLLTVADLMVQGALTREESRGGHYREDYPDPRDEFACHLVQRKGCPMERIPVIGRSHDMPL